MRELVKKTCKLCGCDEDHLHYHVDHPDDEKYAIHFVAGMKKKYGPYRKSKTQLLAEIERLEKRLQKAKQEYSDHCITEKVLQNQQAVNPRRKPAR